jgi:phosphoglycerol transferase MdoB-like AlkP superfamily enzyme
MSVTLSAQIFTVLTGIVIIFQACLAVGMPWGAASMGGKYPGKYPPKMRIVALVNIVVLMFLAIIVLSKAGLLFPQLLPFSKIAIWFVVVFLLLGSVMNSITPSKIERIWAPVAFIQFITSLIVALH